MRGWKCEAATILQNSRDKTDWNDQHLAGRLTAKDIEEYLYQGSLLVAATHKGGEGEVGGLAELNLRVSEVRGELDPIAQSMRTTAGLDTVEGQRIFGAGAKRDMSPAQRDSLQAGEFSTKCPGAHAEITTLRSAAANGLTPWQISASRPFCPNCAATIQESDGVLTSPSAAYWPKQ